MAKFIADVELPRHHHRLNKCITELESVARTSEIIQIKLIVSKINSYTV